MNYRLNTRIVIVVAVLIIVAIGLFAYTWVTAPTTEDLPPVTQEKPADMAPIRVVSAKHQFVDGIHTVAGVATVSTPCHRIIPEPYLLPDGTTVEIRFTTLLEGDDCPAQATDVPFRVTFEAPEGVSITAVWDGAPVRLSLVPVTEGESLDDEFYFKG